MDMDIPKCILFSLTMCWAATELCNTKVMSVIQVIHVCWFLSILGQGRMCPSKPNSANSTFLCLKYLCSAPFQFPTHSVNQPGRTHHFWNHVPAHTVQIFQTVLRYPLIVCQHQFKAKFCTIVYHYFMLFGEIYLDQIFHPKQHIFQQLHIK